MFFSFIYNFALSHCHTLHVSCRLAFLIFLLKNAFIFKILQSHHYFSSLYSGFRSGISFKIVISTKKFLKLEGLQNIVCIIRNLAKNVQTKGFLVVPLIGRSILMKVQTLPLNCVSDPQ